MPNVLPAVTFLQQPYTYSNRVLTVIATVAIVILGSLHLILHYTQDSKEPPLISTFLPFVGSVIGLTRKKSKYYVETNKKHNLPIYTLRVLGARLYIINSMSLITAVQRQHKTLAFAPIAAKFASNLCGSSKIAWDIVRHNINGEEGDWGYSISFLKEVHKPLYPGPDLDAMNRVMAQIITDSFSRLSARREGEKVIRLYEFVKHEITLATTGAAYGPLNPFTDPKIEEAFWEFQSGIMILLMNLFPSVFAKKCIASREFLTKAFLRYFEDEGHTQGSAFIKARYKHSTEHHVPVEDIARFTVVNNIGLLSNTAPASFWTVYHIFSNPVILAACREELSKVITTEYNDGMKICTLDMSEVKSSCPIMLSTLQEVLRIHTVGSSTRMVMKDHLLDNKYLLKKGATVMIPSPVQHTSTETWGPDVGEFNHRRFLSKEQRHNPIAFRAFGGGATLCPGRHFASTEIMTFTAILVLQFDVTPVGGDWPRLTSKKAEMWEVTPQPDEDVEVTMTPRADAEKDLQWRVLVSDSDKAMPISAEDL